MLVQRKAFYCKSCPSRPATGSTAAPHIASQSNSNENTHSKHVESRIPVNYVIVICAFQVSWNEQFLLASSVCVSVRMPYGKYIFRKPAFCFAVDRTVAHAESENRQIGTTRNIFHFSLLWLIMHATPALATQPNHVCVLRKNTNIVAGRLESVLSTRYRYDNDAHC